MKPFLKWAGNKYRFLEHILPLVPKGKRLIEPFTGSAAVFLNTEFKKALLGDINEDLLNVYRHLQAAPDDFIRDTQKWFNNRYNDKAQYYRLRQVFNETEDKTLKASLFLYLNKHGFNGLCRYNRSGGYNVPFGSYKKPYFPEEPLYYFADKIQHADLMHGDFIQTMSKAKKGDVIYCDPPYVPLSRTSNFTQYQRSAFNDENQIMLADKAAELAKRGITVIISNHDTKFTRKIYRDAECRSFYAQRTISCKGHSRKKVLEILAVYKK